MKANKNLWLVSDISKGNTFKIKNSFKRGSNNTCKSLLESSFTFLYNPIKQFVFNNFNYAQFPLVAITCDIP